MRFLRKPDADPPEFAELEYPRDHEAIRRELVRVQNGFCAYSEKRIEPLDSPNVEHFDPRIKYNDGFRNWFAVLGKINGRRPRKIEPFLPLPPDPGSPGVQNRIKYEDGEFLPVDEDDEEISNLLLFVRANDELTLKHRAQHVRKVSELQRWRTQEQLREFLLAHPQDLSFPTALEHDLGIPAFDLIEEVQAGGA